MESVTGKKKKGKVLEDVTNTESGLIDGAIHTRKQVNTDKAEFYLYKQGIDISTVPPDVHTNSTAPPLDSSSDTIEYEVGNEVNEQNNTCSSDLRDICEKK